ncbi:MAG: LVIVD repeat-containing protein [Chitinophagales bacterium]
MRKIFLNAVMIGPFVLLLFVPIGCMKDRVWHTYSITRPTYQTLSQVRANMKTADATPLQNIGKIYVTGNFIFLNEIERGIHIIDNSSPSNPRNAGFIPIPGNEDLTVKDNTLYADSYGDLVAIDISDPMHTSVKKIVSAIFPDRIYYYSSSTNPDSILIVTGWVTKDTTVEADAKPILYTGAPCASCQYSLPMATSGSNAAANPGNGMGGSMSRFTIINDYFYTVSNSNLSAFDVSHSADPQFISSTQIDWHIETIFPFKDKLFIGSNNGMFMFDISSDPAHPALYGEFTHERSCDPVISDGEYAYITLSSGTVCLGFENELQIVDIHDLKNSALLATYHMNHPLGLSKDGNNLFICDDDDGLKVFNAAVVSNLQLIKQLKDAHTRDVIAAGGIALVIGKEGLFEYDYRDQSNIHLIGKLLAQEN